MTRRRRRQSDSEAAAAQLLEGGGGDARWRALGGAEEERLVPRLLAVAARLEALGAVDVAGARHDAHVDGDAHIGWGQRRESLEGALRRHVL